MKKVYFLIFVLFGFLSVRAQPIYHWMNQIGGVGEESDCFISVDHNGSTYSANTFTKDAFFNPGTSKEVKFTKSIGGSYSDLVITKEDQVGNLIWSKRVNTNIISVNTITSDFDDNIIISGVFVNTLDFNPESGIFNLSAKDGGDIFILKLDKDGNFVWAGRIGGKNGDYPASIVADKKNNIALICYISDTVDVDMSSAGIYNLISTTPFQPAYVKITSSGSFLFAHHLKDLEPSALSFDSSGNLYSTGTFLGTKDFDFGAGIFNMTSSGSATSGDCYLLKVDTAGKFIWAKSFGEFVNIDYPTYVTVDKSENVIVGGHTGGGNSDYDPGPGVANLVGNNRFVLKLNSIGTFVWAKAFNGSLDINIIDVDDSNNVFVFGFFDGNVDFNPGPGTSFHSPFGTSEAYILKLDSNGIFNWFNQLVSTKTSFINSGIVTNSGNIYVGGSFSLKTDFDPGAGTKIDSSYGVRDAFILKLSRCLSNSSLALSECKHFELAGHRFDTSEIIDILFTAKDGCDSVVTVNVTVKKVNDTITASGATLIAKSTTGSAYQWLKCPAYISIPGATSTSYIASTSGSYALIITENGCTDTSDCLYVTGLGIDEQSSAQAIKIYPNPSKDIVSIEGLEQGSSIKLLSIVGQEIYNETANGTQAKLSLKNLVSGLYLLQLKTESGVVSTIKIVKE